MVSLNPNFQNIAFILLKPMIIFFFVWFLYINQFTRKSYCAFVVSYYVFDVKY